MPRIVYVVLFVVVMVAVIVGVDLLFFRNHFWARLLSNIGIVMVFAAFLLRFLIEPVSHVSRRRAVVGLTDRVSEPQVASAAPGRPG